MEEYNLTCIRCPMGCSLHVSVAGDEVTVTGNTCPRGADYGRQEVTAPVRTVTTTIKVLGGTQDRVSCKTKEPVPKGKIFEVMDAINKASCTAPVKIGDVLIEDCAGTGVAIVATKAVSKA